MPVIDRDLLIQAGRDCENEQANLHVEVEHSHTALAGIMGTGADTDETLRDIEEAAMALPHGDVSGATYPRSVCQAVVKEANFNVGNADIDSDGIPDAEELAYCTKAVVNSMDVTPKTGGLMAMVATGQIPVAHVTAHLMGGPEFSGNATMRAEKKKQLQTSNPICATDCHDPISANRHADCRDEDLCAKIFLYTNAHELDNARKQAHENRADIDYTRRRALIEKRKRRLALTKEDPNARKLSQDCLTLNGKEFCNVDLENKRKLVEEWAAKGVTYIVNSRAFNHKNRYLKSKKGKAMKNSALKILNNRNGKMPFKLGRGRGLNANSVQKVGLKRNLKAVMRNRRHRRGMKGRK